MLLPAPLTTLLQHITCPIIISTPPFSSCKGTVRLWCLGSAKIKFYYFNFSEKVFIFMVLRVRLVVILESVSSLSNI